MTKQDYIKVSTDIRNIRVQARLYRKPEQTDVEKQLSKLIVTMSHMFSKDFPEQGGRAFINACTLLVMEL